MFFSITTSIHNFEKNTDVSLIISSLDFHLVFIQLVFLSKQTVLLLKQLDQTSN